MCDKMAIYTYILKIVENDPFLRLQMKAKEMFFTNFFSRNKHGNKSTILLFNSVFRTTPEVSSKLYNLSLREVMAF